MKYLLKLAFLLPGILLLVTSCNDDEGIGGSSHIEGYVYNVIHRDDNFTFVRDTIPAVKEDVFLVYGKEGYFGDDVETDQNGMYRFEYLRKGTYVAYAYSSFADDRMEAVPVTISLGSGTKRADDIYIHTGKANGTLMIKGSLRVLYYDNGRKVDEGPGVGQRVYIKHYGEETHFDDVRAGDAGVFVFQKLLPGKYEIYAVTEDPDTEKQEAIVQTIEVTETGVVHELPEEFTIVITV